MKQRTDTCSSFSMTYVTYTSKDTPYWPFISKLSQTDYPLTFAKWKFTTLLSVIAKWRDATLLPHSSRQSVLAMPKGNTCSFFVIKSSST